MRVRVSSALVIVALTIGGALFVPRAQPPARAVPQVAQNILAQLAVNFATQASGVPIGRVLNIGNARVLAEVKEIRAELERINETLAALQTQVNGISTQVKQNGCDINAGPAGTIVAAAIAGARLLKDIADHPSDSNAFMRSWRATVEPHLGEGKQIELNNLLMGSGGTTGILMACGKAEQAADSPFLSRQIYLRMHTILAYYQDAETTLLLLRANQAAIDEVPGPVVERYIKDVKGWLPAQQQIIQQRAMPAEYFFDLRTHLTWMTAPYVVNGVDWESIVKNGPRRSWGLLEWKLGQDYQVAALYNGWVGAGAGNPTAWLHKMVGMTWQRFSLVPRPQVTSATNPSGLNVQCYWSFNYREYKGPKQDRYIQILGSDALYGAKRPIDMYLGGPKQDSKNFNCYALFDTPQLAGIWQKYSYG
jgi:hypothetical protein